jgi:hypothetical protein
MALEVASLLDGVSLGKEGLGKAVAGMNKALSIKNVTVESADKCSVIITIGLRSYLFSTLTGTLQVNALENGPELTKALSKCDSRLVIDPVAFNSEVGNLGEAWQEALEERRKMYLEGDAAKYAMLHNALLSHVSALSAAIPASLRMSQAKSEIKSVLDLEPPSLQVANLRGDTVTPPLQNIRGWLMFSALSTMMGNMGQSNYVAANQFMDQLTFWTRMHKPNFDAITMMWGTVGHIGMRWKAFASADTIYKDPNAEDIVMTPAQAQVVLGTIFTSEMPEWFVSNTFDKATTEYFRNGGPPLRGNPDPWRFKKGKGGGTDIGSEGSFPEPLRPAEKCQTTVGKGAYEGRRVRLHGLVKSPEMNGKKGTLLQETEDGHWIVRFDGNHEDKILKLENLMTLSGTLLGR